MSTVFVTGANRGLGLEFCRQYAEEGWNVIATCRAPDKADALNALAENSDGHVVVEKMDVTDHAQVDAIAEKYKGRAIDLLINNAGISSNDFPTQMVGGMDYVNWMNIIRTNLMAPVKVAESFLENVALGEQKKIVAISSAVGSVAEMDIPLYPYATSKAGLNKATSLMAAQLKDRGIACAVLCPGHAKTDMGLSVEGATVEVDDCIAGLRQVIGDLTLANSGSFTNYEGENVAW